MATGAGGSLTSSSIWAAIINCVLMLCWVVVSCVSIDKLAHVCHKAVATAWEFASMYWREPGISSSARRSNEMFCVRLLSSTNVSGQSRGNQIVFGQHMSAVLDKDQQCLKHLWRVATPTRRPSPSNAPARFAGEVPNS